MRVRAAFVVWLVCLIQTGFAQAPTSKNDIRAAQAYDNLKKYIGKYPKQTKFFNEPLVKSELKKILQNDYQQYLRHVGFSGCGPFMLKETFLYADVSQLHVGGYSSLVFVDLKERRFYLFWLKGQVAEKKYQIYGEIPIPGAILKAIVEEMNQSWGHVAEFEIKDNGIAINVKKS